MLELQHWTIADGEINVVISESDRHLSQAAAFFPCFLQSGFSKRLKNPKLSVEVPPCM